jgi:hypothetical protein
MSVLYRGSISGGSLSSYSKSSKESIGMVEYVYTNLDEIADIPADIYEQLFEDYTSIDYFEKNTRMYGAIKFKFASETEYNESNINIAFPFDRNNQSIPVETESVYITSIGKQYYYKKLNHNNSVNFNTNPHILGRVKTTNESESGTSKSDEINEVVQTGISNNSIKSEKSKKTKQGFQGNYFKRDAKYHQLSLREGDSVFQGRFGNSIRLSGYLHDDKNDGTSYPAFIIRNGENAENKSKKIYDIVDEDVNNDGSSIHITSGEYISKYQPVVDFSDGYKYPSESKGDQIVINSDRVTLSAKGESLFLYGNKNLSLFANNVVSIDSNGIDFTSRDSIFFTAKGGKNIVIGVENGKIMLGSGNVDQQMVLGNKLVNLIGQLIDAINQMQIATPSGPSAPGPINPLIFNEIGNKLKDCLSKTNYLV